MIEGADQDYWINLTHSEDTGSERTAPKVGIETTDEIEPLDSQIGVKKPLTVPPRIRQQLFSSPEEIADSGASFSNTYAVIDAAKVPGLPEMLESSGLEHECLFQGEAERELKDVAPWVVRLEESSSFTRCLFTSGKASWQMWDAEFGIFVRSEQQLSDLRRALRKFTKVKDQNGKWFYFRFWEPDYMNGILRNGDERTVARMLALGTIFTFDTQLETMTVFRDATGPSDLSHAVFHLRETDLEALAMVSARRFARRVGAWLLDVYGPPPGNGDATDFALRHILRAGDRLGLRDERSVADYVAASWLLGTPAETHGNRVPGTAMMFAKLHATLAMRLKLTVENKEAAR